MCVKLLQHVQVAQGLPVCVCGPGRSLFQVPVGLCSEEFVIVNVRWLSGAVMGANAWVESHHQYNVLPDGMSGCGGCSCGVITSKTPVDPVGPVHMGTAHFGG